MSKLKEKSREFVKLAINIGQDNYPEIMAKMYIVNSPFVFKAAWQVISPFIDKKTLDKIHIKGSTFTKDLFLYVDPSNVPAELGGECTCSDCPKGCFFSNKGPWNEYPGDEFGEEAKQRILEEEKKEIAEADGVSGMTEQMEGLNVNSAPIPVPIPAQIPMPVPVPAPSQGKVFLCLLVKTSLSLYNLIIPLIAQPDNQTG